MYRSALDNLETIYGDHLHRSPKDHLSILIKNGAADKGPECIGTASHHAAHSPKYESSELGQSQPELSSQAKHSELVQEPSRSWSQAAAAGAKQPELNQPELLKQQELERPEPSRSQVDRAGATRDPTGIDLS